MGEWVSFARLTIMPFYTNSLHLQKLKVLLMNITIERMIEIGRPLTEMATMNVNTNAYPMQISQWLVRVTPDKSAYKFPHIHLIPINKAWDARFSLEDENYGEFISWKKVPRSKRKSINISDIEKELKLWMENPSKIRPNESNLHACRVAYLENNPDFLTDKYKQWFNV
jgi:hypothetical protein